MGVKVIRVMESSFVGDDGREIQGKYFYVVPAGGNGGQPERIFISLEKLEQMAYIPTFGDTVYMFRNAYGKVIDILKA